MGRRATIAGIATVLVFMAGAAVAADEEAYCRNGSFPETDIHALGLARIVGAGKTHLRDDFAPGCPSESPQCLQKAYLVAGDVVLTGRTRGTYVCAFFPNRFGGSAGWLKSTEVEAAPLQIKPPLEAWIGRWRDGDDEIRLSPKGSALVAKGEAYWPSANPSTEQFPGGPNIGDFEGTAEPKGSSVMFGNADGCRVELVLIGAFLVASDNSACGGMNVRFDGVYRRANPKSGTKP